MDVIAHMPRGKLDITTSLACVGKMLASGITCNQEKSQGPIPVITMTSIPLEDIYDLEMYLLPFRTLACSGRLIRRSHFAHDGARLTRPQCDLFPKISMPDPLEQRTQQTDYGLMVCLNTHTGHHTMALVLPWKRKTSKVARG